jgi:hypothetical protein
MNRETFLANPLQNLRAAEGAVPAEWLREAWATSAEFRQTAASDLRRSINKCGTLFQASGWLNLLRPALSDAQAVDLYRLLLDYTQGVDTGWVADFLAGFPHLRDEVSRIRFTGPITPTFERDEPY